MSSIRSQKCVSYRCYFWSFTGHTVSIKTTPSGLTWCVCVLLPLFLPVLVSCISLISLCSSALNFLFLSLALTFTQSKIQIFEKVFKSGNSGSRVGWISVKWNGWQWHTNGYSLIAIERMYVVSEDMIRLIVLGHSTKHFESMMFFWFLCKVLVFCHLV